MKLEQQDFDPGTPGVRWIGCGGLPCVFCKLKEGCNRTPLFIKVCDYTKDERYTDGND